ncbi:Spore wall maturation protein DIT1 [Colletotrichum orbiculare MAFF 240422]|uniref:Spore wall maturation protein DIT1 n=1 Tax=Colletotrichum orbiculare (strain 104-T / ATCC 96160 / CBS 514.97 / LARS 414 / MAFF 240422) TaxID=1213857 RepID=N4VKN6_COLOR|nr:Spore wall maturation protein DIT1 [Colletotrichum orbiculare MAFF 240422]
MAITAPSPAANGGELQKPSLKPLLKVQAPLSWQKSVLATLDTGFSPIDTSKLKSPLRAFNINMISDLEIGSPIDSSEVEIQSPIRNFSINLGSDDAVPGSPINPSDLKSPLRAVSITTGPAMSLDDATKQDNFIVADDEKITLQRPASIPTPPPEASTETDIAHKIMDVFQSYGRHILPEGETEHTWIGRKMFLPRVEQYIRDNVPVKMIIPSFPWKSINRVDKVIGTLPDLGEDLALARLNALCVEIGKVYSGGAEVHIATDGLVFNDVVGISDDETWEYGSTLMKMAAEKGYRGIKLLRVMDFLGMTDGKTAMTREQYMSQVGEARRQLESQFGNALDEVRRMIDTDNDTLMTYRGFIRFLEVDLRNSPVAAHATSGHKYRRVVKEVAMKMMMRAESFTKIILATCPDYVRLSIHPSSGAVKLSMPLLVERHNPAGFPRTPWHSCIAVSVDGGYRSLHARDVRDTHDLVVRDGRPWCFRERSELFELGEGVEVEHLYPRGVEVRPKMAGERVSLGAEAKEKLAKLAKLQPVRAVGFVDADEF